MKRRTLIGGVAAVAALGFAGAWRFTDLMVKHYPPTPYDDLLNRLADRDQAARLGKAAAGEDFDLAYTADELRDRLKGGLTAAAETDVAAGRLSEADGWVLPESVALLAALAARA